MTVEPLVIWRLTDGKPGHMQQSLGLVRALSALRPCTVTDMDVAAAPVGVADLVLRRFPPGHAHQPPDLVIGAGHATHVALLAARRAAGGRAIVLMKPSLPLFLFDMVIAPEHDGLPAGPRVINTRGVLNPMQPGDKKADSLLVLVGGPSRHVQWDDAAVLAQIEAVTAARQPGATWCVADSRRTPDSLRLLLRERFGERFQPFAECPPEWLAQRLAATETVWVSEDSVSMVYEALTAGCGVGLLQLPPAGEGGRVQQGVAKLVAGGTVVRFDAWQAGARAVPAPAHFNEAERVARWLLERFGLLEDA